MTDTPPLEPTSAMSVLRRALAQSPELKKGLVASILMAAAVAIGKLVVPVLVQQILDRGIQDDGSWRPGFVFGAGGLALAITGATYLLGRATYLRLVRAAEDTLFGLRMAAFDHVHRLSVADAWIAALAKERGATLVHKDPEFKQVEAEVKVLELPYKSATD